MKNVSSIKFRKKQIAQTLRSLNWDSNPWLVGAHGSVVQGMVNFRLALPENTHLLHKGKFPVQLTSYLTG